MGALERVARFSDRVFDRMRHKRAFTLAEDDAIEGSLESLRGHKYALVVTLRRNGEAVPSPTWFGLDRRGRAFVKTRHDAGKVKRVRNDSRILIAPSDMRGNPKGPAIKATARLLPSDEWAHAEEVLAAAYGTGRKISERVLGGSAPPAFIEISAGR